MAIRLKIPNAARGARGRKGLLPRDPIIRAALLAFLSVSLLAVGFFSYWYVKYDRIIEQRFRDPVFTNSAKIYAGPRVVRVGSEFSVRDIATDLRRAGYGEKNGDSLLGSYHVRGSSIEVLPGPESYHSPEPATITVAEGKVSQILSRSTGDLAAYELEPQLVTSLFDAEQRSKRSLVKYDDIPKVMVDAVIAIEDRRFFQHGGVNFLRLAEAAWVDLTHQRHQQGGSTITMQLSRAFFLTPEKTFKRKLIEMLIAVQLEQKFSKQQILEFYTNRVDLGQRGSFTISGFAEGARSYFNKDLKDVTLPEAALLAGLIQAPSYLSPYRHPERALERRNTVIESMVETRAITREQADKLAEEVRAMGFACVVYRGEMDNVKRRANLKTFRDGGVDLLISTDLASRGLDIAHVGRVINYHLPREMQNYLHRAGRTARAGRPGLVVNFVTPRDQPLMNKLGNVQPDPRGTRSPAGVTSSVDSVDGLNQLKK